MTKEEKQSANRVGGDDLKAVTAPLTVLKKKNAGIGFL